MRIGNREIAGRNLLVAALGLAVCVAAAWLAPFFFTGAPSDGMVKIRHGSSIETVRDSLQSSVDVTFGNRVARLLSLTGADLSERHGAFKVNKGDSPFTVMRRLRSGQPSGIRFTFNNVRTKEEWATRVGEAFMMDKEEMLKMMKEKFDLPEHLSSLEEVESYIEESEDHDFFCFAEFDLTNDEQDDFTAQLIRGIRNGDIKIETK